MKHFGGDLKVNTFSKMTWDDYFIQISKTVASKSKDPSTKIGAVIVDENHRPISFGYNGLPQGADESRLTLTERPLKYHYVIHAEMNAILFAKKDLTNCILYCEYAPCDNCLKHIIQTGIKKIVYEKLFVNSVFTDTQRTMSDKVSLEALRGLLESSNIEVINYITNKTMIQELNEMLSE